jgi:hypothetical protein
MSHLSSSLPDNLSRTYRPHQLLQTSLSNFPSLQNRLFIFLPKISFHPQIPAHASINSSGKDLLACKIEPLDRSRNLKVQKGICNAFPSPIYRDPSSISSYHSSFYLRDSEMLIPKCLSLGTIGRRSSVQQTSSRSCLFSDSVAA